MPSSACKTKGTGGDTGGARRNRQEIGIQRKDRFSGGWRPSGVVAGYRGGFFFNDTATTEIYTLSLHDALPISAQAGLWVPLNALGALGSALVLLGLPAVYARMAGEGGLPGLVGFALIEVSWVFFGLFLSLYGALVLPWLAD